MSLFDFEISKVDSFQTRIREISLIKVHVLIEQEGG